MPAARRSSPSMIEGDLSFRTTPAREILIAVRRAKHKIFIDSRRGTAGKALGLQGTNFRNSGRSYCYWPDSQIMQRPLQGELNQQKQHDGIGVTEKPAGVLPPAAVVSECLASAFGRALNLLGQEEFRSEE